MTGHRPRKRFGQNFLHDPGVVQRIVTAVDAGPDDVVVEIGPGRGALTRPLLERAGTLHVVELDRDLVPALERLAGENPRLIVHAADALRFDFCAIAPAGGKLKVVGNLPYNISTPLLFHLMEQLHCIGPMHFMLQKEVVERMAAGPGSKTYGRLSVMIQYHCRVTPLFQVGPGAFRPPPKVDSMVVRLEPRPEPPAGEVPTRALAAVVRAAFGQRRKTLRNTLKGLLDEEAIRAAGIDPATRPENVSLEGFAALARQYAARR